MFNSNWMDPKLSLFDCGNLLSFILPFSKCRCYMDQTPSHQKCYTKDGYTVAPLNGIMNNGINWLMESNLSRFLSPK